MEVDSDAVKESKEMEEEAEVSDEYQTAFDLTSEKETRTADVYITLLQNPRMDETALKIKENIIYR